MAVEIEQEPTPEPSIRDTLRSAMDDAVGKAEEEAHVERPTRVRDESGRFVRADGAGSGRGDLPSPQPREPAVAPEVTADRVAAAPAGTDSGGVAPKPGPASEVAAPQAWGSGAKQLWGQLPEGARAEIVKREADFHKAITAQDQIRTVGNDFMRTANEFAPIIQARGGNPVALFREFMGILRNLQTQDPTQRAALFRDIAARNGVDLSAGKPAEASSPSPSGEQPQIPPSLMQMSREWDAHKRQLAESRERQAQEARAKQEAEMQETAAEIDAFRSKPENQHFDAVKDLMASILRGGAAESLEQAYQIAVRAHPEVSKLIEQQNEAARKAEEAKRAKADAARRKAGSVRSGPGNTPEVTGSRGTVRDDLRAAFEEVRGRI